MDDELRMIVFWGVIIIMIVTFGYFVCSYFEMKAFNRHSETKATITDALFSELRIMAD